LMDDQGAILGTVAGDLDVRFDAVALIRDIVPGEGPSPPRWLDATLVPSPGESVGDLVARLESLTGRDRAASWEIRGGTGRLGGFEGFLARTFLDRDAGVMRCYFRLSGPAR
jgi:hypothetical protein